MKFDAVVSFLECWLVTALFLIFSGETFVDAPLSSLQLMLLLLAAHAAGRSIDRDSHSVSAVSSNSFFAHFLDLNAPQYPEVYAAFIGAWTGSAFVVMDWRVTWIEFPRLGLAAGTMAVTALHLARRVRRALRKLD